MNGINQKSDNGSVHIHDMLKEYLNLNEDDVNKMFTDSLNDGQRKAFELFKSGKNLFIIGAGGVGKSHLIKTINNYVKSELQKRIYLCSTTGISAYNIGGMTINAFMGIGTGEESLEMLIRRVYKNRGICDRIYYTDVLIIDEISMMSAALFEKINLICQKIKRNKKFFGGIQLVITGDLLQLIAIFGNNKFKKDQQPEDTRLIIESDILLSNFKKENTVHLKENVRQKNDSHFIDLLSKIRYNTLNEDDIKLLNTRLNKVPDESVTGAVVTLVSTNKKAQTINEDKLNKLKEKEHNYQATFDVMCTTESSHAKVDLKNMLKKELENQFTQKGIHKITLKKGVHVMLIKNLDVDIGLVNGLLGVVVNFVGGLPEILFNNKIKKVIGYSQWELEMDNCKVVSQQLPLMLSYALTVHKTQSITLDAAILDLGDCFCDHQVYVAMSRLRSLDGVYLKSFNNKKITVNKKMIEYLQNLEERTVNEQ